MLLASFLYILRNIFRLFSIFYSLYSKETSCFLLLASCLYLLKKHLASCFLPLASKETSCLFLLKKHLSSCFLHLSSKETSFFLLLSSFFYLPNSINISLFESIVNLASLYLGGPIFPLALLEQAKGSFGIPNIPFSKTPLSFSS